MRPLDANLRAAVLDLHRQGLKGSQIARKLGFIDRSKANYIIRGAIGPRPRPIRKMVQRKCARCGRVDVVEPYHARQAKHCGDCRQLLAAASNRANHVDRWTTANCRECGRIFTIRKCDLESRRRGHLRRFRNAAAASFVPFCERECYTVWQRNNHKASKRRRGRL